MYSFEMSGLYEQFVRGEGVKKNCMLRVQVFPFKMCNAFESLKYLCICQDYLLQKRSDNHFLIYNTFVLLKYP